MLAFSPTSKFDYTNAVLSLIKLKNYLMYAFLQLCHYFTIILSMKCSIVLHHNECNVISILFSWVPSLKELVTLMYLM